MFIVRIELISRFLKLFEIHLGCFSIGRIYANSNFRNEGTKMFSSRSGWVLTQLLKIILRSYFSTEGASSTLNLTCGIYSQQMFGKTSLKVCEKFVRSKHGRD